jgi:hypothetical protein
MKPDEAKLLRGRMAETPFAPADGPIEFHSTHALNYIAFYLGEIDHKMERIAKALEGMQISAGALTATLKMIQGILVQKT